MNIKKYDNKMVRVETIYDDIYEGISYFYSEEYNNHEYGENEDSIQMSHIMIYKSQIKSINEIDNFSNDYGKLEEEIVDSGLDLIEEVFESDDDISIFRLLLCIENYIDKFKKNNDFIKVLDYLININDNSKIIEKSKSIRKMVI